MINTLKKNRKTVLYIIVFIVAIFFILQWWAKSYVKDLLSEKVPPNLTLQYSDLNISLLQGNVILYNAAIKIKNKNNDKVHTHLALDELQLNGVGYWNLLFNERLTLGSVKLIHPKINYYPYKRDSATTKKTAQKGLKTIEINKFSIVNGDLNVLKNQKDSIQFSIPTYDFSIFDCKINLDSSASVPFVYENYNLKASNLFLNDSDYETLKIKNIVFENKNVKIINLDLIPKYDRIQLSNHLKKERDHIKLSIPEIALQNFDLNVGQKDLKVAIDSIELSDPKLEVYRDKLLPDDMTVKSLYSKMLRNIAFELHIKQTKIKNGFISYAELVHADKNAGELTFKNVNATLDHISNLKNAKKTEIKVQARFMGKAPLELNWTFDVNSKTDALSVNASIKNLPAPYLDPFLKPNLNVVTEGILKQVYFSFDGNNTNSKGKMKMKYGDFKVKILNKKDSKVNKILTAIGDIFINDGETNTDDKGFRYGEINAERDPTKSFFNYLWINVKSGVLTTLTGDGEKK